MLIVCHFHLSSSIGFQIFSLEEENLFPFWVTAVVSSRTIYQCPSNYFLLPPLIPSWLAVFSIQYSPVYFAYFIIASTIPRLCMLEACPFVCLVNHNPKIFSLSNQTKNKYPLSLSLSLSLHTLP